MTIGTEDLELIKREVAGIREFYNARLDSDLPPIEEEVDCLAARVSRLQEMWRDGEKRAILGSSGMRTGRGYPTVSIRAWTCWTLPTCGVC